MDVVERNKQSIDLKKLEVHLGIPVVPMNARLGKGTQELKRVIANYNTKRQKSL